MSEDNSDIGDFFKGLDIEASVGTAEIDARKFLGNDRYDELVALNRTSALTSIAIDQGQVKRLNSVAKVWDSVAGSIQVATLLLVILSVYMMVSWALH